MHRKILNVSVSLQKIQYLKSLAFTPKVFSWGKVHTKQSFS